MAQATVGKGFEANPVLSPSRSGGARRSTTLSYFLPVGSVAKPGSFGGSRAGGRGRRRAPLRVSTSVAVSAEKSSVVREIVL
ncbi:hypothetical protein BHM03_00047003 [Ensete ventricosum]|nr:hypothetical protein BHM03_00047003 [Ensete ventricosum]